MGDLAGWDLGTGTLLGDLIREMSDNKWNIFCLVRFVDAEECLREGKAQKCVAGMSDGVTAQAAAP